MKRVINSLLARYFRINNAFLLFLPLLTFYIALLVHRQRHVLEGDEPRYLWFANNLLHGFFSPAAPDINLWSGPGYPIFLMPFVALHVPLFFVTLCNGVFMYLSVVLLYKSLITLVNKKIAITSSLFWGLNFYTFNAMPMVLTEPLTCFLISAFLYSIVRLLQSQRKKHLFIAGITFGYLALTKIIFGYIILFFLAVALSAWLFTKQKSRPLRLVWVFAISLCVNIPYLLYTHHLTNRLFYWGNSGGMSLYWMSTPYDYEYGDWKGLELGNGNFPEPPNRWGDSTLKANHKNDIAQVLKYKGVKQDDEFKRIALANIKAHPKKFFKNCVNNISRMLFDEPFSYTYNKNEIFGNAILGSCILIIFLYSSAVSLLNFRRLTFAQSFILMVLLTYLGLSTIVSAYPRQLYVIMPWILFWATPLIEKTVRITPIITAGSLPK